MKDMNRINKLAASVATMSQDEIIAAMYMNPYGLQNRKAYTEFDGVTDYVALIDIDSLKWVNDNLGHTAGDRLIEDMSKALLDEFDADAYHLSGDEFAVVADNRFDLNKRLRKVHTLVFPRGVGFSYGIAKSLVDADHKMQQNKALRTRRGERAARGECPPTIRTGGRNGTNGTGRHNRR